MIEYYIISFLLGMLVAFGACWKIVNHDLVTEEDIKIIFKEDLKDD